MVTGNIVGEKIKSTWNPWILVPLIAVTWLVLHLSAFLAAANLFNSDAAIAGIQSYLLAQKGIFPIFLAGQSYMGMAPDWIAALLERVVGLHLWTVTFAWALPSALAFGLLIDGLYRYVSWRAAIVFVIAAMFMALRPLDTILPGSHEMGLLGIAILFRWIIRYRSLENLPDDVGSFLLYGLVIGFFWYSDELILPALVTWILILALALRRRSTQRPLVAAAAGVAGMVVGYLPSLIYWIQTGSVRTHHGIASLREMLANIHIMLQAYAWGLFGVPYANKPISLASGIFVLVVLYLCIFRARWATPLTRWIVASPILLNMALYTLSTAPIDMYSIRYLFPAVYGLGIVVAISVDQWMEAWRARKAPVVPVLLALLLLATVYDGTHWVSQVRGAGPDSTITSYRHEATWLIDHKYVAGWGDYWTVYMLDLLAWPHLAYASNTNLMVPSVLSRAQRYCNVHRGCPVILTAEPTSSIYLEEWNGTHVGGELRYGRLLRSHDGILVFASHLVSTSTTSAP